MLEIENVLIIHTVPILAFPTLLFHSLILTSEVEFAASDETSRISSPDLLHWTGFHPPQSWSFSRYPLLILLEGKLIVIVTFSVLFCIPFLAIVMGILENFTLLLKAFLTGDIPKSKSFDELY